LTMEETRAIDDDDADLLDFQFHPLNNEELA
jgi:hypothetical protein